MYEYKNLTIFVASKPLLSQQRVASASSVRSTSSVSTRELATYEEMFSSRPECPLPEPEREKDIILLATYDENEYDDIERFLSDQIECPIKLIACKNILSESKEKLRYSFIFVYLFKSRLKLIFAFLAPRCVQNLFIIIVQLKSQTIFFNYFVGKILKKS